MEFAVAARPVGPRILVVEDESIVALDLAATLTELGYSVIGTASHAEEAIAQISQLRPELILMDIGLGPGLDGIQVAQAIRRIHNVPVIYISAHSDVDMLLRAARTGPSGYLFKPFTTPALHCAIEVALQRQEPGALHRQGSFEQVQKSSYGQGAQANQRTSELEQANRELEAFSYSVAHDLRMPLRTIDGLSQLLSETHAVQLGMEGVDYLNRVRAAAGRMNELIDALLALAKVGRAGLQPQCVELSDLVHSMLPDITAAHPGHAVDLAVADNMQAWGDPQLLSLVVRNLLDNAWKFTRTTDGARVQVGMEPHGNLPTYFVRDNGVGFDPVHAGRMFEAFQRLHVGNEFTGTGIGLAIVQRVIQRHGGKIWAQSQPGQGAAFFFSLPRQVH